MMSHGKIPFEKDLFFNLTFAITIDAIIRHCKILFCILAYTKGLLYGIAKETNYVQINRLCILYPILWKVAKYVQDYVGV